MSSLKRLNTFAMRYTYRLNIKHNQSWLNLPTQLFSSSTIKAKSKSKSKPKQKQKYNPSVITQKTTSKKGKTINIDSNDNKTKPPSLSEYDAEKQGDKGWNGLFLKCHDLLNYNPFGITSMMHSFNTLSFGSGAVSFATIYALSYYSIYSFPASWFFAWCTIRVFTDLYPLFPTFYCQWVEKYAFKEFPILKQLKFSRKLPDPELQSFSDILKERLDEKQRLKYKRDLLKKGQQERWKEIENNKNIVDEQDMPLTDEMVAKGSVLGSWKVKSRQYAKKYGLSYDIVENIGTLIFMPTIMCLYQVIGINDVIIGGLMANYAFLNSNEWIIKLAVSYSVATYLNRLIAIPLFRFYCVPKYYDKFAM